MAVDRITATLFFQWLLLLGFNQPRQLGQILFQFLGVDREVSAGLLRRLAVALRAQSGRLLRRLRQGVEVVNQGGAVAAAIAGVLLCSGIDFGGLRLGSDYLAGNLLIFAATLGSAFYNSYGKKALEWHSPMRMLFWTYVAVCAMMAPSFI